MNDLYSLSQLIKSHPLYSAHKEKLLHLYRTLGGLGLLSTEALLAELKQSVPDLFAALQKNHALFKTHYEETVRLRLQGVQMLCYGEALYPSSCYWMEEPPLTLTYLGSAAWLTERTLAVVGSREPTFESMQWMEKEFALFCEKEKPCVVSGGARGIDQKSHATALRKDTTTIVVLPSGLGHLYPANLQEWMVPILNGGGCFLSEYAYEQKMHKHLFHHRNRLIAALGKASLLVEAKKRSGTLITAQQSLQLGRPVWVVPGHPLDPHFSGSLELLMDGALLVRDAQDLSMHFAVEFANLGLQVAPIGSPENGHHYR
ncbi:DNA-processing protein DprA [Bdellovibrio sp. ArHS]|uniref:DNA-processing protein DprA n=1 Tax=Bdellovibrio sp. ArHS TaxID=1569284 RepID=UPI000A836F08|nr:DNA-processing protein DprA [Bdellovibrio sp. ArHS]